jgi:hypothetical protein
LDRASRRRGGEWLCLSAAAVLGWVGSLPARLAAALSDERPSGALERKKRPFHRPGGPAKKRGQAAPKEKAESSAKATSKAKAKATTGEGPNRLLVAVTNPGSLFQYDRDRARDKAAQAADPCARPCPHPKPALFASWESLLHGGRPDDPTGPGQDGGGEQGGEQGGAPPPPCLFRAWGLPAAPFFASSDLLLRRTVVPAATAAAGAAYLELWTGGDGLTAGALESSSAAAASARLTLSLVVVVACLAVHAAAVAWVLPYRDMPDNVLAILLEVFTLCTWNAEKVVRTVSEQGRD